MSVHQEPRSRRALLGAGLGAIAATVAGALGRPQAALAVSDPVELDVEFNLGTATTGVSTSFGNALQGRCFDNSASGVYGFNEGHGYGVAGRTNAAAKAALFGENTATGPAVTAVAYAGRGVDAKATTGVGVAGHSDANAGVYGESDGFYGVYGEGNGFFGVYGHGSQIGVHADGGFSGFGLKTNGRLDLATSGVATIPAGATFVTVNPFTDVVATSFVLLTPAADIGARRLWYTKNATTDRITIRISSSRTSATKVSWLLLG